MANVRSLDFLPEIFRTDTNQKFLSATLDQLTQQPNFIRTRGYIGRRYGPGINPRDGYVIESTPERNNYQLEPGVVMLKPGTNTVTDAITYPGFLDALSIQDADTNEADRLFASQSYSWDAFIDYDKFVNYSQYYWLPNGPDSVDIRSEGIPVINDFDVTRTNVYRFRGVPGPNPTIFLVRGGYYTFDVDQTGSNFWIQTTPGVAGGAVNRARNVFGVTNNGEDDGQVVFRVPTKDSQANFYGLTNVGPVDLATDLLYNEINGQFYDEFVAKTKGIDGITDLNNRTLIFLNPIEDPELGGWQYPVGFDNLIRTARPRQGYNARPSVDPPGGNDATGEGYDEIPWDFNTLEQYYNLTTDDDDFQAGSYDTLPFDQLINITDNAVKYSIWQINLVPNSDNRLVIQVRQLRTAEVNSRVQVSFGTVYGGQNFYKNSTGTWNQMPPLTAVLDTLYYQDSTNPSLFGIIKLVEQDQDFVLDVEDILGAKTYTSPNGVQLTNGMKIEFQGQVVPSSYQGQQFYIEGVGSGPGITQRVGFVNGQAYFGAYHVVNGQKVVGATPELYFQPFIWDDLEQSIANQNTGVGSWDLLELQKVPADSLAYNGIRLIPVRELVTPELINVERVPFDAEPYDSLAYDEQIDAPIDQDYFTINRSDRSLNPWTRSNRWFHKEVIDATARYNEVVAVLDNNQKAKRPIIEFRSGLRLFNSGTLGIIPVNVIDFITTDALSTINGQAGYAIDGYTFLPGTRVIFAADTDLRVRNKVYEVEFVDFDDNGELSIRLVEAADGYARPYQQTVCMNGATLQGKSFWFDGVDWQEAQTKNTVNQAPLFDVVDADGFSFGDTSRYTTSTFVGSKLFSYARGTGPDDPILGFPLKYLNIDNIGDIVFDNNLYTDTFIYVQNRASVELNVSTGFVTEFIDQYRFTPRIGWQTYFTEEQSQQVFQFTWNEQDLVIDVPLLDFYPGTDIVPITLLIDNRFVSQTDYVVTVVDGRTVINIPIDTQTSYALTPGTPIVVIMTSLQPSETGFYEIPNNLENNPFNQNSQIFTLGTVRNHYNSIAQTLPIVGDPNGSNNIRDFGNIVPYGSFIKQHSSPLPLAGFFLRNQQYDFFNALQFNSREYSKFKAQFLDTLVRLDISNYETPAEILVEAFNIITAGRTSDYPFYWSDMCPTGTVYDESVYVVTPITGQIFDTLRTYNFTEANYQAIMVYRNGQILLKNVDYEVLPDTRSVTVLINLAVGDVITIREYTSTAGNFVPNTPTKLGLYPAYRPNKFVDDTYVTPQEVIRGHDGSLTIAFGDFRDDVLLEFETRIYNNLKVPNNTPIPLEEVLPGQFRETQYSLSEINEILSRDFLSWIGWNKLDYRTQTLLVGNQFTYNYGRAENKLNGTPLAGFWRGIYFDFYDTDLPHIRPWFMLGLSEKPDWWDARYGSAPYTRDNLVLWDDLAAGYVADPVAPYINPLYVRPELQEVIPVDSEGNLLSPLENMVGDYNQLDFRRSWVFGDQAPVETVWRRDSSWPFAVMRLLALTKPAKFFSLFVDRDQYKFDPFVQQYLFNGRYRLDAQQVTVYGNGKPANSYINWIVDYTKQIGLDVTQILNDQLGALDVRLCYRAGAFTDKRYLKMLTEKTSPNSQNTSLLLPDESYTVDFYKNQPSERLTYSSVIVMRTDLGYQVYGYSTTRPYFEILKSLPSGTPEVITAGDDSVRVNTTYDNNIVLVPYGYEFTNRDAVVDFLLSYGKALEEQGAQFVNQENGIILNWQQMAREFLYWSQQGWATGTLLNLNPGGTQIQIDKPGLVVDSLRTIAPENVVLDQNKEVVNLDAVQIDRFGTAMIIKRQDGATINYVDFKFTNFEHLLIFDNRTVFNDLIYQPFTGDRQGRLQLDGIMSADWDGTLDAKGFILNRDNIDEWNINRRYTKGDIVKYKNLYYSAAGLIEPGREFNFNDWLQSDFAQIKIGLLANLPTKADDLANSYNIYSANLESDADLMAYHLIGFVPREYMRNLNLDDVSQINLYRQFIRSKGTTPNAEIFTLADIGKERAEYNILENWAVKRAEFGASYNRRYFELSLDEASLTSNPSTVQIVSTNNTQSDANQTVTLNNLYKTSRVFTSPDIMPLTSTYDPDIALPTAGYVNLNDVDYTVFDVESLTNGAFDFTQLLYNDKLWIAKVNDYDWDVYSVIKVEALLASVSDNLDGTSTFTFDAQHGLDPGDIFIVRFFNEVIDGVYTVDQVPNLTTITVALSLPGGVTQFLGTGTAMKLTTSRVDQPSDIADLDIATRLLPGGTVWIDQNASGRWQVVEKRNPFEIGAELKSLNPVANSGFGTSIAQGFYNLGAMVGAPYTAVDSGSISSVYVTNYGSGYSVASPPTVTISSPTSSNATAVAIVDFDPSVGSGVVRRVIVTNPGSDYTNPITVSFGGPGSGATATAVLAPGAVESFVRSVETNEYIYNSRLFLSCDGTESFGYSLDIGDQLWGIAGAPDSANGRGYAAMIYRPAAATVFPENFSIWQVLCLEPNDWLTAADEFGYSVALSQDEQWAYIGAPGANSVFAYNKVEVQDQYVVYTADQSTESYNWSDYIIVDNPLTQIVVYVNNIEETAPWTESEGSITISDLPPDATVKIARRTQQTFIGDGTTQTFDLSGIYTATDIYSITVTVDDRLLRPGYDYDYDSDSSTNLFLLAPPPNLSEVVVRAATYFRPVARIAAPGGTVSDARFGKSLATTTDGQQVIIGAPDATTQGKDNAGNVYIFDRSVERFIVQTAGPNNSFTTTRTPQGPVTVTVNGQQLINVQDNINGEYSVAGSTITVFNNLNIADVVEIATNDFQLIQTLPANEPMVAAAYGSDVAQCLNNCSVYIGAPNDSLTLPEAGSVERWVNQARLYGTITGTEANPSYTPGDIIRINNIDVELGAPIGVTNAQQVVDDIIAAGIPNVTASVTSDERVKIDVINLTASTPGSRLTVLPGSGTALSDLGLEPYVWAQRIESPKPIAYGHFGKSVFIDTESIHLIVGAPEASTFLPTTFDVNRPSGTTTFDAEFTTFTDPITQSGAAYSFDYLSAANPSKDQPGKFVFGQQLYDTQIAGLDRLGTAVNYTTGILLVTAPGTDEDSNENFGRIIQLKNTNNTPVWQTIHEQTDRVNIDLFNSVFIYDKTTQSINQYLDYFDPIQGKILGAVRQNLDYITAVDPAFYNNGDVNASGVRWDKNYVGTIWWNLSNTRYIEPLQNDINYASRRWGSMFPGSTADVYQWISSSVPPDQYPGPGTPFSATQFTLVPELNLDNVFQNVYYFWVTGLDTIATSKTLSINGISQYLEDPRSSGIGYVAPINASSLGLYNINSQLSGTDIVLHVEFEQQRTDNNVHVEYELIRAGDPNSFLPDDLYRKFLDSMTGHDTRGSLVPDVFLPVSDLYGVRFRPRQGMFVNRQLAVKNYLTRANSILIKFPITETRSFNLLDSSEPEPLPDTGAYNQVLATYDELQYQDLAEVGPGYQYLIQSDGNYNGRWTIYVVNSNLGLGLVRVQSYVTRDYWYYTDWYQVGFVPSTRQIAEVANTAQLTGLNASLGDAARVTDNGQGKWEIYQYNGSTWNRVGLQDGTIQFSAVLWNYVAGRIGFDLEVFDVQFFDQEPVQELRNILRAINEELFVGDLLIERNNSLMLIFQYILSEQPVVDWLIKTSLIDVDHKVRELVPFVNYARDNQDFVLDYIKEVKPYHSQISQFNLRYDGSELAPLQVGDFDLPAFFDTAVGQFVSPVLDDTGTLSTTSSFPSTSAVWQTWPYSQWYENYQLSVASIDVYFGGSNYTELPEVRIEGQAIKPAVLRARISGGQVTAVDVLDPGYGYSATPVITLVGGSSSADTEPETVARCYAVMTQGPIRNFSTVIKFDRYVYQTQVLTWEPDVSYDNGTLVRYQNRVWEANSDDSTGVRSQQFDPTQWILVPPEDLNGIDRVAGYYVPGANQPGLDLQLLVPGLSYPGVETRGPRFDQNPGYDLGPFDVNVFDNLDVSPAGYNTYSESILDVSYESNFADIYLGTRPSDINVDGGAFIDTYSSHAPEELIPGSNFDTLDLKVFTRRGSDWTTDGHGYRINTLRFDYPIDGGTVFDFSAMFDSWVSIDVVNTTTGVVLVEGIDYTIDYVNETVDLLAKFTNGDVGAVYAYGIGGGSQLYLQTYTDIDLDTSFYVPVGYSEIETVEIWVDGHTISGIYWVEEGFGTRIFTASPIGVGQRVTVLVLGVVESSISSDWSSPTTQVIVADGTTYNFNLDNYMGGLNEPNLIVNKNGLRVRPFEAAEYTGDGTTLEFSFPATGGTDYALTANNEVYVWVDGQPQIFSVDWARVADNQVRFYDPPGSGKNIIVAIQTSCNYRVSENVLEFNTRNGFSINPGDIITVQSFNDTAQQDFITLVFQGPTKIGQQLVEGYDTVDFDIASIVGGVGSFDRGLGAVTEINQFNLGRFVDNRNRIHVTLNGALLTDQVNLVQGTSSTTLVIAGPTLQPLDVLAVTIVTNKQVPDDIGFRIFKDMNDAQVLFRIDPANITRLARPVGLTDETIYVEDVNALGAPNLDYNRRGVMTIGGERITFTEIDYENNSVSGLMRGTAGTGASVHAQGDLVYDLSFDNFVPIEYQNRYDIEDIYANGTNTVFTYNTIRLDGQGFVPTGKTLAELQELLIVRVAGTRIFTGYSVTAQTSTTITVTFTTPPTDGVLVQLGLYQGRVLYNQNTTVFPYTASDGIPLQETRNRGADFINRRV